MLLILSILILHNIFSCIYIYKGSEIYGCKVNPISVFNIPWLIVLDGSYFAPFGLNRPSELVILLGVLLAISYNIGYFFAVKKISGKNVFDLDMLSFAINEKIMIICNFFGIIYIIPIFRQSIEYLRQGNFSYLREVVSTTEDISQLDWVIMSGVIQSIFMATLVITIIKYIQGNSSKIMVFLCIIDILLYTLSFGGRWFLFRTVSLLIIVLLTNRAYSKFKSDFKVSNIITVLFISILLLYITSERMIGASQSVLSSVTIYFLGPMSFCSELITNYQQFGNYLFGTAFFSGIIDILLLVFTRIIPLDILRPSEIIGEYTGRTLSIGDGIYFNGFASCLFDFYTDFGVFGCIVDGLLLGLIIGFFYRTLCQKKISFPLYCIYNFLLLMLLVTPIKWEFDLHSPWMTILFIFIFSNTGRKKYE